MGGDGDKEPKIQGEITLHLSQGDVGFSAPDPSFHPPISKGVI